MDQFRAAVAYLSQMWGGSSAPIVPLAADGRIDELYQHILPGAVIDGIIGGDENALTGISSINLADEEPHTSDHLAQLAVAMLDYHAQESYSVISACQLADNDPWRDIYAACLGQIPDQPDPRLLRGGRLREDLRFEDFVRVERPTVLGNLSDLIDRLTGKEVATPRQATLWNLASGIRPTRELMIQNTVLPDSTFRRAAAGPNLVVVCTPGNTADLALLWNLRAAHGESHALPIGIPKSELTTDNVRALNASENRAFVGWGMPDVTFVSASVAAAELRVAVLAAGGAADVADIAEVLEIGPAAGRGRYEALSWSSGQAPFVAINDQLRNDIVQRPGFNRHMGLMADVAVLDTPIAAPRDARFDGVHVNYVGGYSSNSTSTDQTRPDVVIWPNTMLMAGAVLSKRDLALQPSEPGRACAVLCSAFSSVHELQFLAHPPLLALLQGMAETRGASLMKRRARDLGTDSEPMMARSSEDLVDRSANAFKAVIGNNTAATELWLLWAENHQLLVKGFPLRCSECHSKQWIPVAAFRPPIVCIGCGLQMQSPFGQRTQVQFTYRLSERLRRVYEHDAMGHLLAMRFFATVLGQGERGRLIGLHPGLEVTSKVDGWAAEIDLLLLDQQGNALPVEVKRSFSGVTDVEVDKLDEIGRRLHSPWSAFAVTGWGKDAPLSYAARARRDGRTGDRLMLADEHLLKAHASWTINEDPFEWSPLDQQQIDERDASFATSVREWINVSPRWLYERSLLEGWPNR